MCIVLNFYSAMITLTSGSCKNNHRNDKECDTWAKYGHCKINKWMTIHCAKSCGECKTEDVTTAKPDKNDRRGNVMTSFPVFSL